MLEMTKDQRTIARQRETIEELEETVRQLREELTTKDLGTGALVTAFPLEWKLARAASQILAALYNSRSAYVSRADLAITACVNRLPADDDQFYNLLSVQVVRLRRAMKPYGVEIKTIHGSGYALPPTSKAIIKDAIERRAEG